MALNQNSLKHVEAILVLNQYFKGLCIVKLLSVLNNCLLVLVVDDFLDHIRRELLDRELLELRLQILENAFALFNGPVVEGYLEGVVSVGVLSESNGVVAQLLIYHLLLMRGSDPGQAFLDQRQPVGVHGQLSKVVHDHFVDLIQVRVLSRDLNVLNQHVSGVLVVSEVQGILIHDHLRNNCLVFRRLQILQEYLEGMRALRVLRDFEELGHHFWRLSLLDRDLRDFGLGILRLVLEIHQ